MSRTNVSYNKKKPQEKRTRDGKLPKLKKVGERTPNQGIVEKGGDSGRKTWGVRGKKLKKKTRGDQGSQRRYQTRKQPA